jgi:hypothetical protein
LKIHDAADFSVATQLAESTLETSAAGTQKWHAPGTIQFTCILNTEESVCDALSCTETVKAGISGYASDVWAAALILAILCSGESFFASMFDNLDAINTAAAVGPQRGKAAEEPLHAALEEKLAKVGKFFRPKVWQNGVRQFFRHTVFEKDPSKRWTAAKVLSVRARFPDSQRL